MSEADSAALASRARQLNELVATLTPETCRAAAQEGMRLLGEPTGDPDGLDDLAVAFRHAAEGLRAVGQDTAVNAELSAAWRGPAAAVAGEQITDDARQVADEAQVFATAGEVIGALADQVRQDRRDHEDLRQRLVDLDHRTAEAGQDRLGDLAVQVADALHAGSLLLTRIRAEHEAAADRFRQLVAGPGTGAAPTVAAARADRRLPLDEIHRRYQVSVDPEGMTIYPNGATGWLCQKLGIRQARVTVGEARLLDQIGPFGVKDAYDAQKVALNRAENTFSGHGITDGHADAFRHAYWNALLTHRFGPEWTEHYCTAHERNPENTGSSEAMDLHNNEVGRRIATQHPDADPDELAALVEKAVRDGEMVVIDRNGRLAYSDQLDPGQTGHAEDTQPTGRTPGDPGYHSGGGYNPGSDAESHGTAGNY
ncbi:DUF6973 domain-containing protein [Streptoalloteichus hindustanus]|uniref:DUF6973 domain-containing protein n=1 Tax=Streptoalloteichus hindustanus TaxID=2017 RepID=A0A1M5FS08_STRHI|nr:hypothetical protein [Streptoalloteichus hindustanus]SHF94288.1 hypothetical protein SAMN05444320_105566 [Streptoalloteichus hindustanus]